MPLSEDRRVAKNAQRRARYAADPVFRAKARAATTDYYLRHPEYVVAVKAAAKRAKEASYAAKTMLQPFYESRSRAKKKGVPHNITFSDLRVPEKCPVLGLSLVHGVGRNLPNSPSIDRVVPALGYVRGNINIISNRANVLKNDATLAELRAVVAYMERELEPDRVLHTEGIV